MSRVLRINESGYRIKVQDGSTITLDTGTDTGTTIITGNLLVKGDSTTVNSVNSFITDNILILNREVDADGDPISHVGITLGSAGIEIERGTLDNAQFLFDESIEHYDPTEDRYIDGTFVLKTSNGVLSAIRTTSIANDGTTDFIIDLSLNATTASDSVVKIKNGVDDVLSAANYAQLLLDDVTNEYDNAVVNKHYVDEYVYASGGVAITDRIIFPITAAEGVEDSKIQAYGNRIEFLVAQTIKASVSGAGFSVNNILMSGDTITNTAGSSNLIVTANSGSVEVDATLVLKDRLSAPGITSGRTKIYSLATVGAGDSGLYIKNPSTQDELVVKNRALLFSMLF
jgi:hypothetical protein